MVIMGAEAQAVAVAWQVYEITHRAIDLGYTGLVLFLPGLLFLLPAGHVADRYDRRQVILVCYALQIRVHPGAADFRPAGAAPGGADFRGAVPDRLRASFQRPGKFSAAAPPGFHTNTS